MTKDELLDTLATLKWVILDDGFTLLAQDYEMCEIIIATGEFKDNDFTSLAHGKLAPGGKRRRASLLLRRRYEARGLAALSFLLIHYKELPGPVRINRRRKVRDVESSDLPRP